MKRFVKRIILLAAAALSLLAVSCREKEEENTNAPFLEVSPESLNSSALGEGDAIIISIRSNVPWTVSAEDSAGNPVSWIVFEATSGSGNADIRCFILAGSRNESRSCKIIIRSDDGTIIKSIDISQEKYTPVLTTIFLTDVLKNAYSQSAGVPGALTPFTQASLEVIGVPGANLPNGFVYVSEGGRAWTRLKTTGASAFHVGDVLMVDFTDGTITKESTGGYTIDVKQVPTVSSSGASSVSPAYISSEAIPSYENMLVEIRNVQAPSGTAGAAWSGNVSLLATDEKDRPFGLYIQSGASFGTIGSGNGAVRGIVVDGKIRPRTAEDVAGLTGSRLPDYTEPYRIAPVINVLQIGSENNTLANATISGKTKLTFSSSPGYSVAGAAIEKVGGGSANNMTVAATNLTAPFNNCFTTIQWHLDGTYLLYTMPVTQKTYGDLEFAFGMSCGKDGVFNDDWTVSWSSDGTNFKPVDAVYCTSVFTAAEAAGATYKLTNTNLLNNRQVAEFSIPENEALTSGNIYIKLMHPAVDASWSSRTLRMNCGSVLSSRTENTPKGSYDNILAMENFESCLYGHNPIVGIPTYHFTSFNALDPNNTYSSAEGWSVTGNSLACRGCIRLSADTGENFIMSPTLDKLSVPTDITVTFKAAPFVDATKAELLVHQNNIKVGINGAGQAGEIHWDGEYSPYLWRTATVKISGASSNTRILIGNIEGAAESQCYIDDIVISR